MLPPLGFQGFHDHAFALAEDDVNVHFPLLLKTIDSVAGLDEVVELVTDSEKDGVCAMALKIASAAGNDRLGCQDPRLTSGEVQNAILPDFEVLRTPYANRLRDRFLNSIPLLL